MTKLDIYDALVARLIYSADWRSEHPAEANAYVDGLIDATAEIENRLRKEEDSAAENADAISKEDVLREIDAWVEMDEDILKNPTKVLKEGIKHLRPYWEKAKEGA